MNEVQLFEQTIQQTPSGTPDPDQDVSWAEALQGLNPIGWPPWQQVFWRSLAKNMGDTVKGIPQLPEIAWALTKEVPNMRKAPGILAGTIGDGQEFIHALQNAGMPIFAAMASDYIAKYGSIRGFKYTLATDPFSIIADLVGIIPGAGTGAKTAQMTGNLGKAIRILAKTRKTTDDIINLPAIGAQKAVQGGFKKIQKQFAMNPENFDVPIQIHTGRFDEATEQPITQQITPRELAQKLSDISGTQITPEDLPIQALTDNVIPMKLQEVIHKAETEIAPKIAAEYDAASELVKGAQQQLIAKYPTQFKKYWNTTNLAEHLLQHYIKTQKGQKGHIGELFHKKQADLDIPLHISAPDLSDIPLLRQTLPRTEAYIQKLLQKYNGNIENVTNPDIKTAVQAYYHIAETLSNLDNLTLPRQIPML